MTADHRAPSGVKPTGGELGSAAAPSGLGRALLLVPLLLVLVLVVVLAADRHCHP
ncbi:MAG: hypothetical protein ABSA93_01825 [Streptosporangiaceae bacterium]|jgi:hypothetical protein